MAHGPVNRKITHIPEWAQKPITKAERASLNETQKNQTSIASITGEVSRIRASCCVKKMKSFQAQATKPFVANGDGTYIAAGDSSGDISLWEVTSGRLLKKWNAHYRGVTCLVFSEDDSLLISGAEDGFVRVWSLFMIFDDVGRQEASKLYKHSFAEHTLSVTDIANGYGGSNAIIVSASEDRTCKVWSLSKGKLLRNIVFPSIIDAIALDPGEHVFFAGGRDGKIYITALNAESSSKNSLGMHILGSLSDHSKAITFLEYGMDGNLLVSGSEDGMVRVWDVRIGNLVHTFKSSKGLVRQCLHSQMMDNSQASLIRLGSSFSPPLEKYGCSTEEDGSTKTIISLRTTFDRPHNDMYLSSHLISNQIKEFQQEGSGATEMEMERLKVDCKRSMEMVQQWKQMYVNLHEFCVNKLLDGEQVGRS